jgi:hypothetical protein
MRPESLRSSVTSPPLETEPLLKIIENLGKYTVACDPDLRPEKRQPKIGGDTNAQRANDSKVRNFHLLHQVYSMPR